MGQELTAAGIVNWATAQNQDFSERRLESWRDLGIVQKPVQHGLGRGPGPLWVYPADTCDRLAAFWAMQKPNELLAETCVRFWLRGNDFDLVKLRIRLTEALVVHRNIRNNVNELGAVGYGEKLVTQAQRKPAQMKHLGETKIERETTLQEMGEALADVFTNPTARPAPNFIALFLKQMNVPEAATAVIERAFNANLSEEMEVAIPLMASADSGFESATDEQLLACRMMLNEIRKACAHVNRVPAENPMRDFAVLFCRSQDESAFAFALNLQNLKRFKGAPLDEAITKIRAFSTVLASLAKPDLEGPVA